MPFNLQTYSDMLNKALNRGYRFIGFVHLREKEVGELKEVDEWYPMT